MEKIIGIEECSFEHGRGIIYEGGRIQTDKRTIKFGISSGQNCCEHWGYFSTLDNPDDFIGANLLDVELCDSDLKVHTETSKYLEDNFLSVDSCIFVTVKTSVGDFQLTVYNEHNGYYGHGVMMVSDNEEFFKKYL